jgi:hypothetical protein
MNCATHADSVALAKCEGCMQPFCSICLVDRGGHYFCSRCLSSRGVSSHAGGAPEGLCRPGTAFGLGLIPGVGAICNGEYFKAFVHVVVFGFLISISSGSHVGGFEPLFGLLISAFYFYMPLEAYQTARRKLLEAQGVLMAKPQKKSRSDTLWTGMILILLGVVFFLNTIVPVALSAILKLWPALLIIFGIVHVWMAIQKGTAKEKKS